MRILAVSLLIFSFLFAACQANQTAANSNQAAPAPQPGNLSPKEVLKALNEASKKKDVAEIKSHLSVGSLAMLDKTAESQNKTADQILTTEGGAPFSILPEMRDEKINGDRATVEVQNMITKGYEIIPFVKENGEWKAALDIYTQDLLRRAAEDMKSKDLPRPPGAKQEETKEQPSAEKNSSRKPDATKP